MNSFLDNLSESSFFIPLFPDQPFFMDDLSELLMALAAEGEDEENDDHGGSSGDETSPFVAKTHEMVEDSTTDGIVSWRPEGNSFVVWDICSFSYQVLPRYFKHNNFSSFVRQLNTYGFRKVHAQRWEFANGAFLMGQKQLLWQIRRRRTLQPCQTNSSDGEVHRLRREKHFLTTEISRLRELDHVLRAQVENVEQRLSAIKNKQRQTASFLSEAVRNPEFLQRWAVLRRSEELDPSAEQITEAATKRRRRSRDDDDDEEEEEEEEEELVRLSSGGRESDSCSESAAGVSELEELALEMQGYRRKTPEDAEVPDGGSGGRTR